VPDEVTEASVEADAVAPRHVEPLLALVAELDPESRLRALTHSSWTDRRTSSWGRLAFLGDSILGLAIAEHLFRRFPRSDIGRLTKIHGQVVSGRACAEIAAELGVPQMLEDAYPEDFEGGLDPGELVDSERAMASIVESLIGACYLDFGLERTADALLVAFAPQVELASGTLLDFKSALQERLARQGRRVSYAVVDESGPPHHRVFRVEARVDEEVLGAGTGASKKAAEQAAAAEALGGLPA
jgi:ribonuclease III